MTGSGMPVLRKDHGSESQHPPIGLACAAWARTCNDFILPVLLRNNACAAAAATLSQLPFIAAAAHSSKAHSAMH